MSDITIGTRVVVTKGHYKNKSGTVILTHGSPRPTTYSVTLDEPASFSFPYGDNSGQIDFQDHRLILVQESELQLLTDMGEAIYGPTQNDSEETL